MAKIQPWSTKGIEQRVDTILDRARDQLMKLADAYRRDVLLPLCHRLRVTYMAGNGTTAFYIEDDANRSIGSADDAEHEGGDFVELISIFNQLDVGAIGNNDCFGYYVADITKTDAGLDQPAHEVQKGQS
jgi:hypothetical protein